jgi:hypothetical protein
MAWTTSALLVLAGIAAGPYGLKLLSPSVLLLVDPLIVMALGMLGVFIGLAIDVQRSRPGSLNPVKKVTPPAPTVLALLGGVVMAALLDASPVARLVTALSFAGVAVVVAYAGWLLVGQADSDREQQVFVIGSLLLIGGGAAYTSLSAVFAGLLAGIVWSSRGDLARARIVQHLDYFQHPLLVVMLLVAGASITFSFEVLALVVIVAALHAVGRGVTDPFPVSAGTAAIALALDVSRGALQ